MNLLDQLLTALRLAFWLPRGREGGMYTWATLLFDDLHIEESRTIRVESMADLTPPLRSMVAPYARIQEVQTGHMHGWNIYHYRYASGTGWAEAEAAGRSFLRLPARELRARWMGPAPTIRYREDLVDTPALPSGDQRPAWAR